MKALFYVLLCLLTFDVMSRGEGNSSGGPRFSFSEGSGGGPRGRLLSNNGGVGGGPRLSIEQVNEIDNIEVHNEIRFPKTFKEKCLLLADPEIQTIQFRNGEILTTSELFGDGGVVGGGGTF